MSRWAIGLVGVRVVAVRVVAVRVVAMRAVVVPRPVPVGKMPVAPPLLGARDRLGKVHLLLTECSPHLLGGGGPRADAGVQLGVVRIKLRRGRT